MAGSVMAVRGWEEGIAGRGAYARRWAGRAVGRSRGIECCLGRLSGRRGCAVADVGGRLLLPLQAWMLSTLGAAALLSSLLPILLLPVHSPRLRLLLLLLLVLQRLCRRRWWWPMCWRPRRRLPALLQLWPLFWSLLVQPLPCLLLKMQRDVVGGRSIFKGTCSWRCSQASHWLPGLGACRSPQREGCQRAEPRSALPLSAGHCIQRGLCTVSAWARQVDALPPLQAAAGKARGLHPPPLHPVSFVMIQQQHRQLASAKRRFLLGPDNPSPSASPAPSRVVQ